MALLQLSYDELPSHLKSCFLCFSIYLEVCVINKEQLVYWWIGEGFVPPRSGRLITEIREDCFSELTNRCLIKAVDKTYNGTIYTCTIHDMVCELVLKIAGDDGLFKQYGTSCHHLGLTSNLNLRQLISNQELRALVSTTKTAEVNKIASSTAEELCKSHYLWVLDVSKSIFLETSLLGILNQISSLKHLTYINLGNTHP